MFLPMDRCLVPETAASAPLRTAGASSSRLAVKGADGLPERANRAAHFAPIDTMNRVGDEYKQNLDKSQPGSDPVSRKTPGLSTGSRGRSARGSGQVAIDAGQERGEIEVVGAGPPGGVEVGAAPVALV